MRCKECDKMQKAMEELAKMHNAMVKQMRPVKKATRGRQGLTRSDIRIILMLSTRQGLSVREIADRTGYSKSVVGKYVKLNKDSNGQYLNKKKD